MTESVSKHDWNTYTHDELYEMVVTNAKAPDSLTSTQTGWEGFTSKMTESQTRVEQLLSNAGVVWEGQAAESMQAGVSPLAVWANEAATAGQASQASVQEYVEGFTRGPTACRSRSRCRRW